MKIVKVSDKGQIAIPNSVRKAMRIERGDELALFEIDGKILIEKSKKISEKIRDDFRDLLKFSEQSLKEIWDNEEDEIWSSYLK